MQLGQMKKYKLAALLLLLSALLVLLLPGWAARREGFQLTLLDVGQGDALLVSADGYNVLIDGGGRPTDITGMAERVVIPYLKAQGIGRLDVVFNTHPDTDHIGGLFAVLDELRVDYLAVFRGYLASERQEQLLALAETRGVPVLAVAAGEVFQFSDNFRIEVLGPTFGAEFNPEQVNNGSLVLRISYQDFDVLTCGDLVGEQLHMAVAGLDCSEIEVLQLPHHGSRYSYDESWYAGFAPQAVFISVGQGNSFGHPGQEVVEYWQRRGVPIWRTDLQGSCRIIYRDGETHFESALDDSRLLETD